MRDNRLRSFAHFSSLLSSARFNIGAGFFAARLRRLLLRQTICIALIFSLLFLPGSSYAFAQAPEIATALVRISTLPIAPISGIIRKLFSTRTQIRRKETMDDPQEQLRGSSFLQTNVSAIRTKALRSPRCLSTHSAIRFKA